jgi:Fe-S-cluster-containing dehydrogenase component
VQSSVAGERHLRASERHRPGEREYPRRLKYCVVACPDGARIYDEHKGVASKCWLCLDWVLGGGRPACVQACLAEARIFGRRSDQQIARILASGRAQPLHPEFGTDPGVLLYIFPGS